MVRAAQNRSLRCRLWPRPVACSDPVLALRALALALGFGRSLSLPWPFESLSVRTHADLLSCPEPEPAELSLRRYHKQLCRRAVCPHGTICGRPHCPRAKMFYDRAAFITAGSNITAHEAFPGNALPWPPYLGRGAWRTRVAGTQNGHAFAIQKA